MAVIQISKIQVRRGLEEDLPQLAAGELGWATDTRKLFIGNGVLGNPDFAPEIGNTEILTVFAADALEVRVDALEANVANLQSNIASLSSQGSIRTIIFNNNASANTSLTFSSLSSGIIDYNIIRNGTDVRTGTITVSAFNGTADYRDEYNEKGTTGVTLNFVANVSNASNVTLQYTTSDSGNSATFNYYLKSFTN